MENRRKFIRDVSSAALSFYIFPRHVLGKGFRAPSDKIVIAGIGAGGRGLTNLTNAYNNGESAIGYLCDVNDNASLAARKAWPKARYFNDWRELADKEQKNIDAIMVSTPDHNHAIQTYSFMQLGKSVYTETPVTHDIYENRLLASGAKRYRVLTQSGNQADSSQESATITQWIKSNLIGDVARVHIWANQPVGIKTLSGNHTVPKEIKWDLWLGTAPYRDFDPNYLPGGWKGWTDFGTGSLGAHGPQMIGLPYKALDLSHTISARLTVATFDVPAKKPQVYPDKTHLHLQIARRDNKPPVEIIWYDGGYKPNRPIELKAQEPFGDVNGGLLFEGSAGKLLAGYMGRNPRLLPDGLMEETKTLTASGVQKFSHQAEWTNGILQNKHNGLSSSFESSGFLTETLLLGNILLQTPDQKDLTWDYAKGEITNYPPANKFLKREYRAGWQLKA